MPVMGSGARNRDRAQAGQCAKSGDGMVRAFLNRLDIDLGDHTPEDIPPRGEGILIRDALGRESHDLKLASHRHRSSPHVVWPPYHERHMGCVNNVTVTESYASDAQCAVPALRRFDPCWQRRNSSAPVLTGGVQSGI